MRCYCCDEPIRLARKVKLRPNRTYDPSQGGPSSIPYQSYIEDMTYRWAFICNPCYRILDNEIGLAEIPGHGEFNIAGASRFNKAATVDEAKYEEFQKKEASRLGISM